MLQSKAGYIDARPLTASSAKPLATHGRTIHMGHSRRFWHVRSMSGYGINPEMPVVRFLPVERHPKQGGQLKLRAVSFDFARYTSRSKTLPRPPHPSPASVTIAIRPSGGVDNRSSRSDLGCVETEIFLQTELDTNLPRRANHRTMARANSTRIPDALYFWSGA